MDHPTSQNSEALPPLVLTLKLDPHTFEQVNALRQQYFPPQRNLIPPHVTLFHDLPGAHEREISQTLESLCTQTVKIPVSLPALRSLGGGVAISLEAPVLLQLQQTLAQRWSDWLTRQDSQSYRPHITIQNKVSAEEAKQTYAELNERWQTIQGYGEGLLLWHYLKGPWQLAREFSFIEAAID